MKKLILILSIISLYASSQEPEVDKIYIRENALFNGESFHPDSIDQHIIRNNDTTSFIQPLDSLSFNKNVVNIGFQEYTIKADTLNHTFTVYLGESEISPQLFLESYVIGYNNTGSTITNGTVLYSDSSNISNFGNFKKATATDVNIVKSVTGVATHNIEDKSIGFATRYGNLTYPGHGHAVGSILHLSDTSYGDMVDYEITSPNYDVRIGRVLSDSVILIFVTPFNNNDTYVNSQGILNGIITKKQAIRDTIISNNLYFETYNMDDPDSDLPFLANGHRYLLNTTSNVGTNGYARVQLTYGTESNIAENHIYIDYNSGSPILAVSTTAFPNDATRLAECGVFDQTTHEIYGFAYFQRFNNSVDGSLSDGWVNKAAKRIRLNGSIWESGNNPTVSIVLDAAAKDSVNLSVDAGIIWQFSRQTSSAINEKMYYWFNCPSGGKWVNDLNEVDSTSDGEALHVSNNTWYGLNIYYVQKSGDFKDIFLVASPSGEYSSGVDAVNDISNYSVTTVPTSFSKTTVRLCRLVLKYSTSANGTITNELGAGGFQDERGQPLGIGGGGSGSSGGVSYPVSDATWSISDNVEPTKLMNFQLSSITTGNTRTLTVPDQSGILMMLTDTNTLSNRIDSKADTSDIFSGVYDDLTGKPDIKDTVLTYSINALSEDASPTLSATLAASGNSITGINIAYFLGTSHYITGGANNLTIGVSSGDALSIPDDLPQSGTYNLGIINGGLDTLTITSFNRDSVADYASDSNLISGTASENQIMIADADGNAIGKDSVIWSGGSFDITGAFSVTGTGLIGGDLTIGANSLIGENSNRNLQLTSGNSRLNYSSTEYLTFTSGEDVLRGSYLELWGNNNSVKIVPNDNLSNYYYEFKTNEIVHYIAGSVVDTVILGSPNSIDITNSGVDVTGTLTVNGSPVNGTMSAEAINYSINYKMVYDGNDTITMLFGENYYRPYELTNDTIVINMSGAQEFATFSATFYNENGTDTIAAFVTTDGSTIKWLEADSFDRTNGMYNTFIGRKNGSLWTKIKLDDKTIVGYPTIVSSQIGTGGNDSVVYVTFNNTVTITDSSGIRPTIQGVQKLVENITGSGTSILGFEINDTVISTDTVLFVATPANNIINSSSNQLQVVSDTVTNNVQSQEETQVLTIRNEIYHWTADLNNTFTITSAPALDAWRDTTNSRSALSSGTLRPDTIYSNSFTGVDFENTGTTSGDTLSTAVHQVNGGSTYDSLLVIAVIDREDQPSATRGCIIDRWTSVDNAFRIAYGGNSTDDPWIATNNGTANSTATFDITINTGLQIVSYIVQGTTAKFFENGIQGGGDQTLANLGIEDPSIYTSIGGNSSPQGYFDGVIYEVFVAINGNESDMQSLITELKNKYGL